jgi:anti-anti-sigma factor
MTEITLETHSSKPNLKIITIKASIDGVSYETVEKKVLPVVEQEESSIILDLTNVDYLNSMGVMSIIKFHLLQIDKNRF